MTFADRQTRLNVKALRRFGALHLLNGVSVQGDFVKPGKDFSFGSGLQVTALAPTLVVADGDVPASPVGKAATCETVDYSVMEAKPDGHGLTALELQKGL